MKKIAALLLALLMFSSCLVFTSCQDPLAAKIKELDAAYVELGYAYYYAVEACAFAGVYTADPEIKAKFATWKTIVRKAKSENNAYLDYDEAQMDELIAKWKTTTEELKAITEIYKYVPEE